MKLLNLFLGLLLAISAAITIAWLVTDKQINWTAPRLMIFVPMGTAIIVGVIIIVNSKRWTK